jgi:hypothetical protein
MRIPCVVLMLLLPALAGMAEPDNRLFIRPWTELEPLVRIGDGPYPIPASTAQKAILDDAQQLVSGMVYGWTFSYVPGDRSRAVPESFVLTPVAVIPRGTPRLRVLETEVTATRLTARILYTMDDDETLRRAAWDSNTTALSTGHGTAPLMAGPDARSTSLREAIRDAIRLSLDASYINKPRQITGEVVLWDDPIVLVREGVWDTTVTVKVLVHEVVPYRIF